MAARVDQRMTKPVVSSLLVVAASTPAALLLVHVQSI
jgi:hypothetical protein